MFSKINAADSDEELEIVLGNMRLYFYEGKGKYYRQLNAKQNIILHLPSSLGRTLIYAPPTTQWLICMGYLSVAYMITVIYPW